jgi:hypothetical protein
MPQYTKTRQVPIALTDTLVSQTRSRDYFGIQNPDGANPIYVTFNGSEDVGRAATTTNGIRVGAGEFYDIQRKNFQEIRAIATGGVVNSVVNEG